MNLPYAYDVLAAADEQRPGFIKLRGLQADHEVRLMAAAGLVEAIFDDGKEGPFISALQGVAPLSCPYQKSKRPVPAVRKGHANVKTRNNRPAFVC